MSNETLTWLCAARLYRGGDDHARSALAIGVIARNGEERADDGAGHVLVHDAEGTLLPALADGGQERDDQAIPELGPAHFHRGIAEDAVKAVPVQVLEGVHGGVEKVTVGHLFGPGQA